MLMERPKKKFNWKWFIGALVVGSLIIVGVYFVTEWYMNDISKNVADTLDIDLAINRGRMFLFWISLITSMLYGFMKVANTKIGLVVKFIFLMFSVGFFVTTMNSESKLLELKYEDRLNQESGIVVEGGEKEILYSEIMYKMSKAIRDNFVITTLLWISITDVITDLVFKEEEK